MSAMEEHARDRRAMQGMMRQQFALFLPMLAKGEPRSLLQWYQIVKGFRLCGLAKNDNNMISGNGSDLLGITYSKGPQRSLSLEALWLSNPSHSKAEVEYSHCQETACAKCFINSPVFSALTQHWRQCSDLGQCHSLSRTCHLQCEHK